MTNAPRGIDAIEGSHNHTTPPTNTLCKHCVKYPSTEWELILPKTTILYDHLTILI